MKVMCWYVINCSHLIGISNEYYYITCAPNYSYSLLYRRCYTAKTSLLGENTEYELVTENPPGINNWT